MLATIYHPTKKYLILLFLAAFFVRAGSFIFYVSHAERYQQPDSMDYHNCALCLSSGNGMHRPDNKQPIFWRTPGYPLFLTPFYELWPNSGTAFSDYSPAHQAAIWVQIILCASIPLLIFYLALLLTQIPLIAWIAAWLSVVHLGLVLSSNFILTEGIGVLLFLLFLLFYYKNFGEQKTWISNSIFAALFLGIFTWMRPMGQFVAVVVSGIMFLFDTSKFTKRLKKIALFLFIFGMSVAPWYVRNHALTGQWFFCPMSGPYLNSFSAPKIIRAVQGMPLEDCIRLLYKIAGQKAQLAKEALSGTGYVLARETICGAVAWPIIREYPWIFIKEWLREVNKTTFDLYSSQLVAFANNSFKYDPLEEFLSEKLASCLWAQPMAWWMRAIVYLELLYAVLLWIGIFGSGFLFMLYALLKRKHISAIMWMNTTLWLRVMPLIGAVLFMTGGFGYARLRLPVEPLMMIISLTFWYWLMFTPKRTYTKIKD